MEPDVTQRDASEIRWIRDEAEWPALDAGWNALLERSGADVPFLRSEIQRVWWRHLGGGEWDRAELRLAVWENRGIAPLFRTANGEPVLRLVGSAEIMDYLDLIAAPEDTPPFVDALFDALAALPAEEWRRLEFRNLRPGSPSIPALERAAAARGWSVTREDLQPCPVIALPDSWEEYLERLDKKQRHEIRRKLRRAEGAEETVEVRMADFSRLPAEVDDFLALMAGDRRKADFLTPVMRTQFHELAAEAASAGILQLAFLLVDGRKAAGFFNFDYRNRIWVYNSGMNAEFAILSPGWVLLAHLVRLAIENRHSAFDFLRGNEVYKFQWGGIPEILQKIEIGRR
jgi:CelD/BcsL family acetyltransferase involved in cellulose biosynthesis